MDSFWKFPYPSQRMPVLARNAVATSQPLATQAGVRMLLKGGNAVDAALAAAITLAVVEPTGNGIGSDAFAIVWDGNRLHGLNGSGRAPRAWSAERFAGLAEMPRTGWDTVTVPGAVDAWRCLSARFGKMPFAELFAPAIAYAADGFPVSPITASRWQAAEALYADFPEITRTFFPAGRAPRPGEIFRCPEQAESLSAIAASHGEAFYRGELARRIADCAAAAGGVDSQIISSPFLNQQTFFLQGLTVRFNRLIGCAFGLQLVFQFTRGERLFKAHQPFAAGGLGSLLSGMTVIRSGRVDRTLS
mgnify:CR=1 FL=1